MFQGFHLLARTTAQENVELPLVYRGEPARQRHQAARRALAANVPPAQLPGEPVHERIFQGVRGATRASMDFYVTDDPSSLPDSKNLAERKNSLLGVGSVRGDSPTLGKDRYWVVVLYASTQ